jgi:hypothetical protein
MTEAANGRILKKAALAQARGLTLQTVGAHEAIRQLNVHHSYTVI